MSRLIFKDDWVQLIRRLDNYFGRSSLSRRIEWLTICNLMIRSFRSNVFYTFSCFFLLDFRSSELFEISWFLNNLQKVFCPSDSRRLLLAMMLRQSSFVLIDEVWSRAATVDPLHSTLTIISWDLSYQKLILCHWEIHRKQRRDSSNHANPLTSGSTISQHFFRLKSPHDVSRWNSLTWTSDNPIQELYRVTI